MKPLNQERKSRLRLRRKMAAMLAAGLLGGALAGCGANNGTEATAPAASPSGGAPAGPTKISIMIPLYDAQPYKLEGNALFEAYEKLTNTDISVTYVPNANYADKLNLTLAGGDMPHVLMVPSNSLKSTSFINAARGGVFWDLTNELKKYPNIIATMNEITMNNTSVDGKTYGIPIPRATARVGLLYRKDLFESLGVKVPTTMDEFYQTAKELKAKKPDIVLFSYADQTTETTWNGLDLFTVSQGGFNIWGLKDGKLTPYYETPEYMNVLSMFRNMYREGLLNKDFAILQGAQKKSAISTGKAAMYITAYDDLVSIGNDLKKVDPKAVIGLQPVMNGKTDATSGHNGLYAIPKSTVKTQEQLDAVLTYFNRTLDPDVMLLRNFGFEGQDYKMNNGVPEFISEEARMAHGQQGKALGNINLSYVVSRNPGDTPESTLVKDSYEKYAKVAVPNLADPYMSPTVTEKGGELDKLVYDARVKYIMGELDDKGYAAAIAGWRSQGGDKIADEFTQAYNKAHGK